MGAKKLLLCLCLLGAQTLHAWEAAVAVRYLHATGKSHSAIFLFASDGKLIRPLSEPGAAQDGKPVFSPDGTQIIFVRHSPGDGGDKLFLVSESGGKAEPVAGPPPDWYTQRKPAHFFDDTENTDSKSTTPVADVSDTGNGGTTVYPTPDGSFALVTKPDPKDDEHPIPYLREGKNGKLQPLSKLPGFSIFWFPVLHQSSPFLLLPHLKAAFYCGEHDSTSGTAYYALDLALKRIMKLSANGASVVPWPGHSGFFSVTSSRYEDLGNGHTANCSYLDWYDADFKLTRFGHALGIYYGASVYLKGEAPVTLPEPDFGD